MQRREVVERGGGRVGAMGDRRGDGVNVVAQAARFGEQRRGEGGSAASRARSSAVAAASRAPACSSQSAT